MNIYIMRHGTTVWNEKGITQGRSNNRLSKNGVLLTKSVAEKYAQTKFDAIVCSPLFRTVQTANLMNSFHKVKIFKDERLTEIDQGIFTGRNPNTLSNEECQLKKQRSKKAKMESLQECFDRVKNFLTNLKSDYPFENLLIITHNCCASFLYDIIENIPIDFSDKKFICNFDNAEVRKMSI